MYIADLHIHSRYSRATSKDLTVEALSLAGRQKGIGLIGTGDFTHPAWRKELREALVPSEEGLYTLKEKQTVSGAAGTFPEPRFVITGEISSIYKQEGRVRKVHNLIILPDLEAAERMAAKLETVGNIHSDGRPILGISSHDLLELTLDICPEAVFVPAHIWTPHFSMFGAFSGFDTVEECFGDLAPMIHAVETGLSSDPPMNWRLSALDRFQLISNSDAHSAAKLGREANLISGDLSYEGLYRALQRGEGLEGTVEFFPEEGKYHYDGHRKCHLCLKPEETEQYEGRCPICGKKLTIGVSHRIEELADRPEGFVRPGAKPFESLVPLREVIAASTGSSAQSVKTERRYQEMLEKLGTEFGILRELPVEEIRAVAGERIGEGIRRLRAGEVIRRPGYDGEYGEIRLFREEELENAQGQLSLFPLSEMEGKPEEKMNSESPKDRKKKKEIPPKKASEKREKAPEEKPPVLNEEQQAAAAFTGRAAAVIAGPGTGKTKTLIAHILYLVQERGVKPSEITAVTFTRKAARELKERLSREPALKHSLHRMQIGTFHALCLELLKKSGEPFVLAGDPGGKQELTEAMAGQTSESEGGTKVLDFDSLIGETLRLLREEKGEALRGKSFHYLLIDEFQDISPDQFELIRLWNREGKELFAIGDPDQSIYGFRGADAECFQKLSELYPELVTLSLRVNYRSAPEILETACGFIRHNEGGHEALSPADPERRGGPIRFVSAASPLSEGIFVAKEINRLVGGIDMIDTETGFYGERPEEAYRSFSEIAVLCRTNRQLELLEKCLRKESIPYVVQGKEDFLSADSVRGTLAFFRWILAEEGTEGKEALGRLAARLLWKLPENRITEEVLEAAGESYGPLAGKTAPGKLLSKWAEEMGLSEDPQIKKLLAMALLYPTMEELLLTAETGSEGDHMRCGGKRIPADAVHLMTLHASKGLEFPVVLICGVEKEKLPLETKKGETDLSEERRLFYVGMTRAKEQLILTGSGEASSFLGELPETYLIRERAETERKREPDGQLSLFD